MDALAFFDSGRTVRRKAGGPVVQTGQLVLIHPAPRAKRPGESEDDFVARIAARHNLQQFTRIAPADLPSRKLRNAWILVGGAVTVDVDRARMWAELILSDRLDAERAALRAQLHDAEDDGDQAEAARLRAELAAKRQEARDLPAQLATLSVPELEALLPG